MPSVRTKSGKVKHYSYTKAGRAAADKAAKKSGTKVMNKKKKNGSRY
jgi:hypothetical protein